MLWRRLARHVLTRTPALRRARYVRYTRWKPTSRPEAVAAEQKLLALCRARLEVRDVPVGAGPQDFMHTISGGAPGSPPLVLVPGYGAGAGFFFRNLDGLARFFRVHAVDLLGTGMSGRPRWAARTREEAEDFFLGGLAAWRSALGLERERMVLVGHSLGGAPRAARAARMRFRPVRRRWQMVFATACYVLPGMPRSAA